MAEVAGADPAGAGVASAMQGLEQDMGEVERLLALSQRPVIAHRLALFLSELQQVIAPVGLELERRGNTIHPAAVQHCWCGFVQQDCRDCGRHNLPWGLSGVSSGTNPAQAMHVTNHRGDLTQGIALSLS